MKKILWMQWLDSFSDNRKSKIRNPKWLVLATLLLTTAPPAEAQQPGKIRRIGFIIGSSSAAASARNEAFRQGLRDLGYVEGPENRKANQVNHSTERFGEGRSSYPMTEQSKIQNRKSKMVRRFHRMCWREPIE